MKFLGLVVVLVFIHCCAAQTNRSSVWLLANTQIFTTESPNPQNCAINVPAGTTGTASSAVTIFETSNLKITGTFLQLGIAITPAADGFVTATTAGSNSILYTVSIQFIYNSTYSITLALPVHGITATPPALITANIFAVPQPQSYWTSTVGGTSGSTSYPIVFGGNTIMSPTGSTWLRFQDIPSIYKATCTGVAPNQIAATSGIIITDYVSSSTIALTLWNDNIAGAALNSGRYNGFYQLGVRTKTSTISSATSTLKGATGCTISAGRKRSLDHLIKKRATLSSCTTSSIDPSMSSTVLSTVCSRLDAVHDTAATVLAASQTYSDLADAFNKGITAMNALYQADFAVFGAGSSKYAIAGNFGILIALSSIIFSLLN